nr:putative amino-acid permease [Quercus suber]
MAGRLNSTTLSTDRKHSIAVGDEPVTSVLKGGDIPINHSNEEWNADEQVLAALGYKAEFKREFNLWTTFCVSFAVLGLLPSFATTLFYGMGYAGTAGMTWGWLVAMIGIQSVAASMAELCSSMPTSGGLYYAAAVLAPPGWGPFAAWITGWSNWLSQVTAAPSVNYGTAALILASASIQNPSYVPTNYQTFLLTIFLLIVHATMASMPTRWIARVNSAGSTFNIMALIVVIILIPAACDRASRGLSRFTPSGEVWGTIYPGTDYPSGVNILMSFIGIIWTMSGYDSAFHLSEECSNANIASPRAIFMTSAVGGTFGWFLQLVVAYTVVDIGAAIDSDLGQPFAAYLIQCLPQKTAVAVLSLTIVAGFFMGQGCMIAASRVTFAYARDGCFPFSSVWKRVNALTQTPVNAVWFNTVVGCALCLLIFGGSIAIGAIFSIGACAAFIAFTIPISTRVFFVGHRFRPGPWNLGRLSIPVGVVATAFVAMMVPFLMLPSVTGSDLDAGTMNWTCVVYGAPMVCSTNLFVAAYQRLYRRLTLGFPRWPSSSGGSSLRTSGSKARRSTSTMSCMTATTQQQSFTAWMRAVIVMSPGRRRRCLARLDRTSRRELFRWRARLSMYDGDGDDDDDDDHSTFLRGHSHQSRYIRYRPVQCLGPKPTEHHPGRFGVGAASNGGEVGDCPKRPASSRDVLPGAQTTADSARADSLESVQRIVSSASPLRATYQSHRISRQLDHHRITSADLATPVLSTSLVPLSTWEAPKLYPPSAQPQRRPTSRPPSAQRVDARLRPTSRAVRLPVAVSIHRGSASRKRKRWRVMRWPGQQSSKLMRWHGGQYAAVAAAAPLPHHLPIQLLLVVPLADADCPARSRLAAAPGIRTVNDSPLCCCDWYVRLGLYSLTPPHTEVARLHRLTSSCVRSSSSRKRRCSDICQARGAGLHM